MPRQIKQKTDVNEDLNVSLGDLLKIKIRGDAGITAEPELPERAEKLSSDINGHDSDIKKMIPKFGRVSLQYQRAGRGGKTVTLVSISGELSHEQKSALLRELKKAIGCGGQIEDGKIVLHGEIADRTAEWFVKAGAKSVRK